MLISIIYLSGDNKQYIYEVRAGFEYEINVQLVKLQTFYMHRDEMQRKHSSVELHALMLIDT